MQKIFMKEIKAVTLLCNSQSNNNAGDNLLYQLVRLLIDNYLTDVKIDWFLKSQWEVNCAIRYK